MSNSIKRKIKKYREHLRKVNQLLDYYRLNFTVDKPTDYFDTLSTVKGLLRQRRELLKHIRLLNK